MDFLGVGGLEIVIILIVALLLWGPGRIVEIARTLGKIVHTLRNTTSVLSTQLTKELEEQKKEDPPPSKNEIPPSSR
jgi:Sec-independent protein translocase protein TatA